MVLEKELRVLHLDTKATKSDLTGHGLSIYETLKPAFSVRCFLQQLQQDHTSSNKATATNRATPFALWMDAIFFLKQSTEPFSLNPSHMLCLTMVFQTTSISGCNNHTVTFSLTTKFIGGRKLFLVPGCPVSLDLK